MLLGQAARRPAGEIIRDVIDSVPPSHSRRERGGQLETWLTMLKEDLARMSGPCVYGLRRWNREWLSLGVTWTQNRQAWAAAIRDVVAALDIYTISLVNLSITQHATILKTNKFWFWIWSHQKRNLTACSKVKTETKSVVEYTGRKNNALILDWNYN